MKVNFKNINVRFLTDPNEIISAQALVYEMYVNELQWEFKEDNPSQIHKKTLKDGRTILNDVHDKRAKWVGVFHENQLIGCSRICERDENGRFEVQYYPHGCQPLHNLLEIKSQPKLFELNREATHKDFREIGLLLMLRFLCNYCITQTSSIFYAMAIPDMVPIFTTIGWPKISNIAFKYEAHDPDDATIYFADFKNGDIFKMLRKIELQLNQFYEKISIAVNQSNYWNSLPKLEEKLSPQLTARL